jgi:hypothetical protein
MLKQLFDIGNLFDRTENVSHIRATYHRVAEHEIEKLGIEITSETVLRDTIRHALIIAFNGKLDKERYDMMAKGFKDFNKFVSDLSFDENRAVLDAAKAVYLANLLD